MAAASFRVVKSGSSIGAGPDERLPLRPFQVDVRWTPRPHRLLLPRPGAGWPATPHPPHTARRPASRPGWAAAPSPGSAGSGSEQAQLRPVLGDPLVHFVLGQRQAERADLHREPAVRGAQAQGAGLDPAFVERPQVRVTAPAAGQVLPRLAAQRLRHRPALAARAVHEQVRGLPGGAALAQPQRVLPASGSCAAVHVVQPGEVVQVAALRRRARTGPAPPSAGCSRGRGSCARTGSAPAATGR